MNTVAMSRIYMNTGAFLGYVVSGMAVESETIPRSVLERILSADEFANKRVIIHRDGRSVGNELKDVIEWGKYIGATFLPIDVTKSGTARFYLKDNQNILQAPKGTAFALDSRSAYLVSSLPPEGKDGAFSTAIPLRIYNHSDLSLQQAIHSILALTLLHYGSVRSIRLPVSTHASDKIAEFLRKNIHPDQERGNIPFWL
jgi:argonaute-like protein implicated in RNA metabolism and viral defense